MNLSSLPGLLGETFYFLSLMVDYNVVPSGIIYAGAHVGELVPVFQTIGFERVLAIEPNPDAFARLQMLASSKVRCLNGALSRASGQAYLYDVAGVPTLNSLLEPDMASIFRHFREHPHAIIQKKVKVRTFALDEVLSCLSEASYNVLYMNVQGGELGALEGAGRSLATLDAVITEVNFAPRYHGCPLYGALDEHLQERGFRMMHLRKYAWSAGEHGEALYVSVAHLEANRPCDVH